MKINAIRARMAARAITAAAVMILAGEAAAQEEAEEQLVTEAEEATRFRYALARISLYERSRLMNKNLGFADNELKELFPKAREILEMAEAQGSWGAVVRRSVLDALLRDAKHLEDVPENELGASREEKARQSVDDAIRWDAVRASRLSFQMEFTTSIEDVVSVFSTVTGMRLVVTPPVKTLHWTVRRPIDGFRATNTEGEECLRLLTAGTGLTYRIRGGAIELVTPDNEPLAMWQIHTLAREIVLSLGMLGSGAREAIPILEELTTHYDEQLAERAKAALRQISGE